MLKLTRQLNELQKQHRELEKQKEEITTQQAENTELKARLKALEHLVTNLPLPTASAQRAW